MKAFGLIGVAIVLFLAGCKGADDTSKATGGDTASTTSGGTTGSQPQVDLKDKVAGTWKFDTASLKAGSLKPDDLKQMGTMMEKARLEIKADGTYTGKGMGADETGKWTISGQDLTMTPDKGAEKNPPKITVEADGSKLHFSGPLGDGKGEMSIDMVKE